ncbi:MAG: hypothetical protein N2037_10070 [Acidimicrobiales bacterium]|nr:hypothetical protein [Acidimicrobiales bacterium]
MTGTGDPDHGELPGHLNWRAVGLGALLAAVVTVPAGLAGRAAERGSTWTYVLFLVIVVGLIAAGWFAGRIAGHRQPQHGAVAALTSYLAVQLVGAVARLTRGASINVGQYVFIALLAASCGTIGGYLSAAGSRTHSEGDAAEGGAGGGDGGEDDNRASDETDEPGAGSGRAEEGSA